MRRRPRATLILQSRHAARGFRTVLASLLLAGCGEVGPAAPGFDSPTPAAGSAFLVQVSSQADPFEVAATHGVEVVRGFEDSFRGFLATLSDEERYGLIEDVRVLRVVADQPVAAAGGEQSLPGWGLDRIDQRGRHLDGVWRYDYEGEGTTVYVVDTGIRFSHNDFGGRARPGFDIDGADAEDCNGHGTHVAASIAGQRFGVAKSSRVVGVRVLDCEGQGRVSDVIAGLDWILGAHRTGPAVVNLSFGGISSSALDIAVQRVLDAGLLVVTSAGNTGEDACLYSPARVDGVLTVAATDPSDVRPPFSNTGPCVDLFAPGVDILSAHHRSDTDEASFSGTSSAASLAAGVALMALERSPNLEARDLHGEVFRLATRDAVASAHSHNAHLLFAPQLPNRSDPLPPLPPPPPTADAPRGLEVTPDRKFVRLVVAWDATLADEIEVRWRPEHGEWRTDRVRRRRSRLVLKQLRSATMYEVSVRSRTRTHGRWAASDWSEPLTSRTCVRAGRSALCS